MNIGKLYKCSGEFVANVNYQLQGQAPTNLWGELIPMEYGRIGDDGSYTIELEDTHRVQCNLRKKVNRATTSIPTRYVYHFVGTAPSI